MVKRLLVMIAFACALSAPAEAHVTGPQFESIFDRVEPAARGVRVALQASDGAPKITVRVSGGQELTIAGLEAEPFLRIGPSGAFRNEGSPTAGRSKAPNADPSPSRPLRWVRVSGKPSWSWYDPRAEWPGTDPPADVKAAGVRATIRRWTIDARLGEMPVKIAGHIDWAPRPIDPTLPIFGLALVGAVVVWSSHRATRDVLVARLTGGLGAAAAMSSIVAVALNVSADGAAALAPVPGLTLALWGARLAWERDRYGWWIVAASGALIAGFGVVGRSAVWLGWTQVALGVAATAAALWLVERRRFSLRPSSPPGSGRPSLRPGRR